jgi:hypothetical protein
MSASITTAAEPSICAIATWTTTRARHWPEAEAAHIGRVP